MPRPRSARRLEVSLLGCPGSGVHCMPNSSYVIRTAPLAEALAHFVLRVDVVGAMQTRAANLVGRRPGIGVHGWEENKMHSPFPSLQC